MAAETPVVSSAAAVRGIAAREHEHFLGGESPEELAAACERLLASPAEGDALARRARDYVAANHSWERKTVEYESVLRRAVDESRHHDARTLEATTSVL
jgi:glycosyltransferase involved in cell wall biosynthesis